jgi:RNA polymerase sigma-70 factor (ECF subfamily)
VAAYEAFGPALLGYACQLTGSPEEAQDAVQEAFLRFFVERRYGRMIENPRAWLYLVLRNYLLDRIKAAPARREVPTADVDSLAAQRQDDPEELVQQSQTAHEIAQALSDREFRCLSLRGEGLSYAEIAEAMAIRTGTVGALLARAQIKLRRHGSEGEKNSFRGIGKALLCLVQEARAYSTS